MSPMNHAYHIFLSRIQPGDAVAVHTCLQPGQLHEKVGLAGGSEALDPDQASDQADQNRWTADTLCQEAGVSAC